MTHCECLYALGSCCCLLLPSTPWTHSLQTELHIHPFWYSKDNTLWTQSLTKKAFDLNCTISIFHFFWHEKNPTFLFCTFGFVVPFIEFHSQLRPCFTLSKSCVNSSVSLIWDFCHLLSILSPADHSPSQWKAQTIFCCTPVVNCVWKPWNSIIWVTGRLFDPYSRALAIVLYHQAQDLWYRKD